MLGPHRHSPMKEASLVTPRHDPPQEKLVPLELVEGRQWMIAVVRCDLNEDVGCLACCLRGTSEGPSQLNK